jgi:hypothetical protein
MTSLNRGHIARCILHGINAQCETESLFGSGLPSVVDRPSAGRKSSMISRRTGFENRQVEGVGGKLVSGGDSLICRESTGKFG